MIKRVVTIIVYCLIMFVFTLPLAAQTDQFQITYGDTVSDGIPGPGAGNIEIVGAQDTYTFDATAGDEAIFDSVIGNNGVFGWRLVAPNGAILVDSFNLDRRLTLPVSGTYTFSVRGFQASTTGVYSFRLLLVPPPQVFSVSIGDTVSNGLPATGAGNLEVPGAVDLYTFSGVAGQGVIFDTLSGSAGLARVILSAPSGAEVFSGFLVDLKGGLPESGTHILRVEGLNITSAGVYSFRLLQVPAPQIFSITVGDTVTVNVPKFGAGNLEVPGSVDIYSFDGLAGQVVIFDALVGNNGQFRTILTAPDGTELFNDFYVDRQVTLPQTGVYSLQVAGSLITNFGIYSFQLLSVPPTAQEFIINIGDTVSDGVPDVGAGNLEVPGAVDIYRFNGLAGQVVIFDALLGNNGQFRVILPAPDGTILLDTFYLDQQISLPQTGIYSLTITGFSVTNFGTYSFSLIEVTNSSPVATDDDLVTDEDIDATIAVLVNDVDVDGDALSVTSVTQPANGTAIINGTEVTYIPNANFNGVDSFTYTVSDGNGGIDTATVNVTINPVNDDPVAIDDIAETNEDVAVIIDVLSNDTDVDGDTLSIESVTQPTTGTVTNNGDDVTYAPNTNFNGTDSFTYTINDNNGGVDTAAVIITVIPVNDSPILTVSTDPITVNEGDNAIRSFTATDVDDDILTVQVQPGNLNDLGGGSYEWSYIADDGLATIPITITVSDGQGGTASGGFNLTALNVAPEAVFANVTGAITVPGAATLSFSNQSDPSQTDTDAGFLYSYDCNNSGIFMLSQSTSASFNCPFSTAGIYTARGRIEDEDGGFTEYFAEVVVEAPFKNTPDANDDLSMTDEDVSFTIDVLSNDTDVDGDILSVVSVTQPANGTVTNNGDDVTYTPNENFNGTDNFTYTVNGENGGVDTASVIVTVIPVNDNPTIDVSTDPIAVSEGDSATRPFMATDVDGDALAVQVQPGNLNDLGNGRYEWSFLTDDGPVTVTVTIVVSDGQGGTTSSTFELTVLNVSPTADFSNTTGTITVPGSVTFAFSGQSDPSQADTNAGFLYSYDCTNSGVFMLSQSSSASFNCPYSTAGIFTARGRIEDKDGGFTDLFAEVVVEAPA
ncbi:MAG: cadherin-like domain-containing protein [Anaerolineae bacterium]